MPQTIDKLEELLVKYHSLDCKNEVIAELKGIGFNDNLGLGDLIELLEENHKKLNNIARNLCRIVIQEKVYDLSYPQLKKAQSLEVLTLFIFQLGLSYKRTRHFKDIPKDLENKIYDIYTIAIQTGENLISNNYNGRYIKGYLCGAYTERARFQKDKTLKLRDLDKAIEHGKDSINQINIPKVYLIYLYSAYLERGKLKIWLKEPAADDLLNAVKYGELCIQVGFNNGIICKDLSYAYGLLSKLDPLNRQDYADKRDKYHNMANNIFINHS